MRPRVRGGYKSGVVRPDRQQLPILAAACEGQTEKRYLEALTQKYPVRLKAKEFPGHHGVLLVDDAIGYADEVSEANDSDTRIVPLAVYDLEAHSNVALQVARQTAAHATAQGVRLFVNLPVIERWFLLHVKHISANVSPRVIERTLRGQLVDGRPTEYSKPGDLRFFTSLIPYSEFAVRRCQASHIEPCRQGDIPCFCEIVEFLGSFQT